MGKGNSLLNQLAITTTTSGKVLGEYAAVNPGPLSNELAGTFSGGRYTEILQQEDIILYRAGAANQPLGQFFSKEPPTSVLQTRIDKAILPVWQTGDSSVIDSVIAVKIPAGNKVYMGEISSQGGVYVRGTQQIIVPKSWTIKGIQIVEIKSIK